MPQTKLSIETRHEPSRLAFIKQHVDFADQSVVDIGGNSGYFSFEALDSGAAQVTLIEGNSDHCEFVAAAASRLGLSDRLTALNRYFDFSDGPNSQISELQDGPTASEHQPEFPVDVMLLLNVLHHVGDDFGDQGFQKAEELDFIAAKIRDTAKFARTLVFQLGFNWKGDRDSCLFPNGTKLEMIEFVERTVAGVWNIKATGIATGNKAAVTYEPASPTNLQRDDTLGEFLNRPLFVLERA